MPIDAVQSGEIFTIRTYKTHVGFSWANTYEVQAAIEPVNSVTAIEALAAAFVSLEQQIHMSAVIIDRIVVSTYIPDGQPYNPTSFTTIPVSLPGQRVNTSEVLPLELALFVRRNAPVGRDGRLLYRGCLMEGDMYAQGFRPLLLPSSVNTFQTIFAIWLTSTFPQNQWNIVLARGTPNPTNVRQVINFQVSEKIAVKKLKNRYFDRP